MIITLIVSGVLWFFFATAKPMAMRVAATSDGAQFERDLKDWATNKVGEGKLTKSDVEELFPEGYALSLGGEVPDRDFRSMIGDISQLSAPPILPSYFLIFVGLLGIIHSVHLSIRSKRQAEQAGDGDAEEAV